MTENNRDDSNKGQLPLRLDEEIICEEGHFAFCPPADFVLEEKTEPGYVVVFHDEMGVEIHLLETELPVGSKPADICHEFIADLLMNVKAYHFERSPADLINRINFMGEAVLFSSKNNHYRGTLLFGTHVEGRVFIYLVITLREDWRNTGIRLFHLVKNNIRFFTGKGSKAIEAKPPTPKAVVNKPQGNKAPPNKPQAQKAPEPAPEVDVDLPEFFPDVSRHPDLTVDCFGPFSCEETYQIEIKPGDVSLLLAIRAEDVRANVLITEVRDPRGRLLYQCDADTREVTSEFFTAPLEGAQGEVIFYLPFSPQLGLEVGNYQFGCHVSSGGMIHEVQSIVRSGRVNMRQFVDLDILFAIGHEQFDDHHFVAGWLDEMLLALEKQLAPVDLLPGDVTIQHVAQDELAVFARINLNTDLADLSYLMTESFGANRSLNVAIVEGFDAETHARSVSAGSPGMILSDSSAQACVVINWEACEGNADIVAEEIIQQLCRYTSYPHALPPVITLSQQQAGIMRRHPLFNAE